MKMVNQNADLNQYLNMRVKTSTLWSFISVCFFKIILDLSYHYVIAPIWGYSGFGSQLDNLKFVESYLLLLIIFLLMPKSSKPISNTFIFVLILLTYIPMLTFYTFNDGARVYLYMVTAFWILVFFLLRILPSFIFTPLKQANIIRYLLFICLGTTAFLLIYIYIGLSYNLSLTNIYETRSIYIGTGIPLAGYLFTWMVHTINPTFFALFIAKRKWFLVALIIALQLLLFSTTGDKLTLFALPFVFILMWVVKRNNPLAYIGVIFAGIILIGMLFYLLTGDVWISSIFTRRMLLIPAQISFIYFNFFSKNGPIYLSHSIFRGFLKYPYELDPANLIGSVYFDQPAMHVNTGIAGDAYMNFGPVGLLMWGILLAVTLKLFDAGLKKVDYKIGAAIVIMVAITLSNTGLLTSLLTHGILLALLLAYLLPKEETWKAKLT